MLVSYPYSELYYIVTRYNNRLRIVIQSHHIPDLLMDSLLDAIDSMLSLLVLFFFSIPRLGQAVSRTFPPG